MLAATTAAVFLGLVTLFLPAFWSAQPNSAIVADVVRERQFRPEAQVVACTDPSRAERDLLFSARVVVDCAATSGASPPRSCPSCSC